MMLKIGNETRDVKHEDENKIVRWMTIGNGSKDLSYALSGLKKTFS